MANYRGVNRPRASKIYVMNLQNMQFKVTGNTRMLMTKFGEVLNTEFVVEETLINGQSIFN